MFPFRPFPGSRPRPGIVFPGFVAQACCNPCCREPKPEKKPCSCRRCWLLCPCGMAPEPPALPAPPAPGRCSCNSCRGGGQSWPQPPCPCHGRPQPPYPAPPAYPVPPVWPPAPQPRPCGYR